MAESSEGNKNKKSLRKFWRIKIKHYLCSRFERELSGQEKKEEFIEEIIDKQVVQDKQSRCQSAKWKRKIKPSISNN